MKEMTLAEAKAEGLLDGKPKLKRATQKHAPRNGSLSRCVKCDAVFSTEAAERRHSDEERHHRFEMVIGF